MTTFNCDKRRAKLFGQHDVQWIPPNHPGEGNILVFNNDVNKHSSIDEITPPINENGEYYIGVDSAYGPIGTTWSYTATDFYSPKFGGAERLPDGNTLITNGATGYIFVVNTNKENLWGWYCGDQLFKVVYVTPLENPKSNLYCQGSLRLSNVHAGATVNGTFIVKNIGVYGSILRWRIVSCPSWGNNWGFTPVSGTGLRPEDELVTVTVFFDAPNETDYRWVGNIKIVNEDDPYDNCTIVVHLSTVKNKEINIFPLFMKRIFYFFPVFERILKQIQ